MTTAWKAARAVVALGLLSGLSSACQPDGGTTAPSTAQAVSEPAGQTPGVLASVGNPNGSAGQRPAFYEGELFTVNMKELPEDASAAIIAKNQSLNEIYASNDLDDEQDFISVIDAIQGEGFNPLWHQNLIVFNAGFTPHQFVSEDEVLAAAAGPNPEITIVETDEVYRCSVVGRK
ncbi:MAG: hypothetical protein ACJ8DC_12865 [Gemmatimonadales bacterium]